MVETVFEVPEDGILASWEVPEFQKHERSRRWYVVSGTIALVLVIYAIMTANFSFAVVLIMGALIMFLSSQREPERLPVSITVTGVSVGSTFHPYHEFEDFGILYQPPEVKRLYLRPKKGVRATLALSLEDTDPNAVRESLLPFLKEDLDRTEESLTEMLARVYKL